MLVDDECRSLLPVCLLCVIKKAVNDLVSQMFAGEWPMIWSYTSSS